MFARSCLPEPEQIQKVKKEALCVEVYFLVCFIVLLFGGNFPQ